MNYTLGRPPHGWVGPLTLDREAPPGDTTHPIVRVAESVVPTPRGGRRSCGNGNDTFARHDDRSRRKADSAFILSARATSAVARHEERGRLADPACPIREAALLLHRREIAGER